MFVRRLSATAIQRTVDGNSSGSSGPIIYMHGKLSNGMAVGSYSLHTLVVKNNGLTEALTRFYNKNLTAPTESYSRV